MATLEYKPSVRLQEAILHATGVGYEVRETISESRKNIILDQSKLIILASQRLTFKS